MADRQFAAQQAGIGQWRDPQPVPPWEWLAAGKARKAAQRQPAGR